MKRIARLGSESYSASDALAGHADLTQILKRHLPPSTVALFARPKAVDGGIMEWYSELGGQPVPFSELPPGEAAQVKRLLDERLDSIEQLAAKLDTQGTEGQHQAALLRQAARYPDTSTLYSLNGQPVITFWGYGLKPVAPPPELPGAAAGMVDGADIPPPGIQPPLTADSERKPRRWWPWLLLALLLLGLLAALLWWLFCREEEPVMPPQAPPAIEQPEEPEIVEPEEEEPVPPPPPPDPLDVLAEKVNATQDCAALQQIQVEEPLLQSEEPKAVAIKQQIAEKLNRDCKEHLIKQAKTLCPDQRPKELAPELIIVFDASGSMDFSINATREEIAQVERMLTGGGNAGPAAQIMGVLGGLAAMERLKREPKRITAAKQATAAVVKQIPSDVNIGMVMIERCPGARSAGFFSPSQRGNLLSQIQGIHPVEGTPLADGVNRAGQMLDGVNKESVMLVVSDGEESCNQDPCAVAKKLAASKPYLKINVVDILGTGAGNCLAQATGGRVFTARNVNELAAMTNQAAQDVLGPDNCRP